MRLLLDSHTLIWALNEPEKLGTSVRDLLRSGRGELFTSIVSAWEISIAQSVGRLRLKLPIETAAEVLDFAWLHVDLRHTAAVRALPFHHRDPFDRMLVAQALVEGLTLVTKDRILDSYGVATIW
jgi:PIN domain nuclease of toxin-antitoxin system